MACVGSCQLVRDNSIVSIVLGHSLRICFCTLKNIFLLFSARQHIA